MSHFQLTNRVALVTGGNHGIAATTARLITGNVIHLR